MKLAVSQRGRTVTLSKAAEKAASQLANKKFAYFKGVLAYKDGAADINPYSKNSILEMCAWSGGYFDAKRGYV